MAAIDGWDIVRDGEPCCEEEIAFGTCACGDKPLASPAAVESEREPSWDDIERELGNVEAWYTGEPETTSTRCAVGRIVRVREMIAALRTRLRDEGEVIEGWATHPSVPRHAEPLYFIEASEVEDGLEHIKEDPDFRPATLTFHATHLPGPREETTT